MIRVKIEKVKINEKDIIELEYESPQDALLHMIYLKTGLLFLKPEVGNHPLLPDNLREFQNIMIMFNKMDTVIDSSRNNALKIYTDKKNYASNKDVLVNNINEFKNYFYEVWIKKNLEYDDKILFSDFKNESVENKNRFLYRFFKKYIVNNTDKQNLNHFNDNVQSFNTSLADVFEIMNSFEDKIEIRNLITAFSIEYSLVTFDILHIKSRELYNAKISDLFHGRIFEFSNVENDYYFDIGSKYLGDARNIATTGQNVFRGENSLMISTFKSIDNENYILKEDKKSDGETTNTYAKSNLESIVKFILLHMVIYYGYRSDSFSNPIVELGNKYYEPNYRGNTQKYTLAPSGVLYKIIDLRYFITSLFKGFNTESNKENNDLKIEKAIDYLLDYREIEKFIIENEDGFLKLWSTIVSVDSKGLIPYHSFDFLNALSGKVKIDTLSRWRRDIITNHSRFKNYYFNIIGELSDEILNKLSCKVYMSKDIPITIENINFNTSNYSKLVDEFNKTNPLTEFYFLNGRDIRVLISELNSIENLILKIEEDEFNLTNDDKVIYSGIINKYLVDTNDFNIINLLESKDKMKILEYLETAIDSIRDLLSSKSKENSFINSFDVKGSIKVNTPLVKLEDEFKVTSLAIDDIIEDIKKEKPRKVKTKINTLLKSIPNEILQLFEDEIKKIELFKVDYVGVDKRKELIETLVGFSDKLKNSKTIQNAGK